MEAGRPVVLGIARGHWANRRWGSVEMIELNLEYGDPKDYEAQPPKPRRWSFPIRKTGS